MKSLKQFVLTLFALCVLAAGAMAVEPQKDGQRPPPPKEKQDVQKPPKPPPPPRDNGNKGGNDNRRGKP